MTKRASKQIKIESGEVAEKIYAQEPFALPDANAQVELIYPNKVSEKDLLTSCDSTFVAMSKMGGADSISAISPNAIVFADNFFGLQSLLGAHAGKVNLIYADPPFGTGLAFQSRQQQHAYVDRFGPATYVEFMRRRLILMRELLADDGSIYLHIGHQMLFHLKMTMDEVFGRANFRNLIVRKKCSSKNYTKHQYPNLNDYILFYSKSKQWKWNQPGMPASPEWVTREYSKVDAKGRYKLVPIHAPGVRNGETGKEWKGVFPPKGKHWQFTPAKLDELDEKGEIYRSRNNNPRRKVYLEDGKQLPLTDYWGQFRDAHHQSIEITGYPTEKNLDMMRTIVSASSNEGDLILDPFMGSGTTLQAANEGKRRWIGIDESLAATEATLRRLRHGLSAMGDYVQRKAAPVVDLFGADVQTAQQFGPITKAVEARFSFVVDSTLYEQYKSEMERMAAL